MSGRGRIAALDGLRAGAILLVVVAHLAGSRGFPFTVEELRAPALAQVGVTAFFVLSGFLITQLLLREQSQTGTLRLRAFYLRRTFRILVPYYAFLLALWAASRSGLVELHEGDLFHALSYTSNYHRGQAWAIGHTWSLSVEEQFYLLWPAALLLAGPRAALRGATVLAVAAPLVRLLVWTFQPAWRAEIGHTLGTVMDALAVGCLLAAHRDRLWASGRYRAFLCSRWLGLAPLAALAGALLYPRPRLHFLFGDSLMIAALALMLDRVLRLPQSALARLFHSGPMAALGTVSYSLYLWQQLFLDRASPWPQVRFPLNVGLAGLATAASFLLVERPSLLLRARVERWAKLAWARSRA